MIPPSGQKSGLTFPSAPNASCVEHSSTVGGVVAGERTALADGLVVVVVGGAVVVVGGAVVVVVEAVVVVVGAVVVVVEELVVVLDE